ncbi:MAG TPA: hypothetical protein GX014_08290 [Firmicutes bacterium]|jgi:hypothetical protein|nr:hypothetical protein [Bacillota bacterium]HHT43380.1 hypothetical protein [Bacillota bacterium]
MDHGLEKRKVDLEEQLVFPWDWARAHYRHVDGWDLNQNRMNTDKYLQEMGREYGPMTIPHRQR